MGKLEAPAVERGQIAHDRQTKAGALLSLIEPEAALQRMLAILGQDPRPIIGDGDGKFAIFLQRRDRHASSCPFAGIVEEIGEHLFEIMAFAREDERRVAVDRKGEPARLVDALYGKGEVVEDGRHRRFTRLTNAFSKKFENHVHMVALYTVWYNMIRIHKTLRMSPAMAAGIADKLWSMDDLCAMMDAVAPKPGPRGPYKKRTAA